MFNKEQAINILIQAAHIAQSSGKLKLQEAAIIAQAISVLELKPAEEPVKEGSKDKSENTATGQTKPEQSF